MLLLAATGARALDGECLVAQFTPEQAEMFEQTYGEVVLGQIDEAEENALIERWSESCGLDEENSETGGRLLVAMQGLAMGRDGLRQAGVDDAALRAFWNDPEVRKLRPAARREVEAFAKDSKAFEALGGLLIARFSLSANAIEPALLYLMSMLQREQLEAV